MKGGSMHKVRHSRLPVTIFALICITFAFWTLEKAKILGTFGPSLRPSDVQPPVFPLRSSPPTFAGEQHESADAIIALPTSSDDGTIALPTFSATQHESADENKSPPVFPDVHRESTNKNTTPLSFSYVQHDSALGNISNGERVENSSYQMVSLPESTKPSLSSSGNTGDCNYAKGKWVSDSKRPLYSGSGCQQWLSKMWSCRLLQRTDFSYEGFRWQPQGCQMPEFSGFEFLKRMQHKTIAFVGDSLGRQQFQSLMCMVTSGEPDPTVQDVGEEYGLILAPGAKRPDGWAYRFPNTNTTILFYWSATLCAVNPLNSSDPATYYALHLDLPVAFLRQYLYKFDVLVLNTGHHWNRGKFQGNRWEMYIGGMPNTDKKLAQVGNAKILAIQSVVKWVDSQLTQHPRLKAFLRTMSPRHFVNGDWNTGGTCDNTVPLTIGSEVVQDNSSDPVPEDAVRGTRVKLLDITALSQLRDEGHISKYFSKTPDGGRDCLHWCLPGIPDTWNEILCAQL